MIETLLIKYLVLLFLRGQCMEIHAKIYVCNICFLFHGLGGQSCVRHLISVTVSILPVRVSL